MRFKVPTPLKGWRVFAGEVGTIVLGVLIALGAQELVQSWHWRSEVRATRKALDVELARNVAAFDYRYSQKKCVQDRLAELSRWAESFRGGTPIALKKPIQGPPWFTIRTAVWEVTDGEIASRIPLEAKVNYAGMYDAMRNFSELKQDEAASWETLSQYENSDRLEPADLRIVERAIVNIGEINQAIEAFRTRVDDFAGVLEIRPEGDIVRTANPFMARTSKEACQPLL